MFVEDTQ